jgi:hypothetical protein
MKEQIEFTVSHMKEGKIVTEIFVMFREEFEKLYKTLTHPTIISSIKLKK